MSDIPIGLCQCGCGNPTRIAARNNTSRGHVKGQPRRYLPGHNARVVQPPEYEGRGLCQCGCGQLAPIAKDTATQWKRVKGQPQRFIQGHFVYNPVPDPIPEDRGYETPCLIYQGHINSNGYGRTSRNGKGKQAHVAIYEDAFSPVPDGYDVHHKCEQRDCIQLSHLESMPGAEHTAMHNRKRATIG